MTVNESETVERAIAHIRRYRTEIEVEDEAAEHGPIITVNPTGGGAPMTLHIEDERQVDLTVGLGAHCELRARSHRELIEALLEWIDVIGSRGGQEVVTRTRRGEVIKSTFKTSLDGKDFVIKWSRLRALERTFYVPDPVAALRSCVTGGCRPRARRGSRTHRHSRQGMPALAPSARSSGPAHAYC